jgi:hypothetical protein
MPCYDPDAARSADEAWTKVNDLTAMLCHTCMVIESRGQKVPATVEDWWKKHKRFDESKPK